LQLLGEKAGEVAQSRIVLAEMRAKRALECGGLTPPSQHTISDIVLLKAAASRPHSKGFASFGKNYAALGEAPARLGLFH
jgi:hypothetical protein